MRRQDIMRSDGDRRRDERGREERKRGREEERKRKEETKARTTALLHVRLSVVDTRGFLPCGAVLTGCTRNSQLGFSQHTLKFWSRWPVCVSMSLPLPSIVVRVFQEITVVRDRVVCESLFCAFSRTDGRRVLLANWELVSVLPLGSPVFPVHPCTSRHGFSSSPRS